MDKIKEWIQRILCAFTILLAAVFTILSILMGVIGACLFNKASDMFVYFSSMDDDKDWDETISTICDLMNTLRKYFLYAKIEL